MTIFSTSPIEKRFIREIFVLNHTGQELEELCLNNCSLNQSFSNASFSTLYVPIFCIPILVVLCTIGNAFNIWILSWHCQPGIKKVLLLALAASDFIVMWCAVPRYLNNNSDILGIDLFQWHFLVASYGVFTWLQYTFCYVSDWILIAFSLERLFVFRCRKAHPIQRRGGRCVFALITIIIIISGLTTSGTLVWYYQWWTNRTKHHYEKPLWVSKWLRVEEQADIALPIIVASCLLLINSWLLIYLKRQLRMGKSLHATTTGSSDHPKKGSSFSHNGSCEPQRHNLTRMLLGCVVLYYVTQLPAVILNTLDHLSQAPHCLLQSKTKAFWQPVVATLALVNYSINFFVYMGMSAKFRHSVMQLLSRKRTFYGAIGRGLTPTSTTTRNSLVSSVSWTRGRAGSHVTFLGDFFPRSLNNGRKTRNARERLSQRSFSLVPMSTCHTTVAESAHTSFNSIENLVMARKSL